MPIQNRRHAHARATARAFLESIFTDPGAEIPFYEIVDRANAAKIASSSSILNTVCIRLVDEGFLVRLRKGIYSRSDQRGVALALPEPEAAPAPLSPEAALVVRFAGLLAAIGRVEAKVDVLTHGVLDTTDLGCIQRILGEHIRAVAPVLDSTGLMALEGLKSRVGAAMVASAVSGVKVNGEEVAHGKK
jgi:hypothetical protein